MKKHQEKIKNNIPANVAIFHLRDIDLFYDPSYQYGGITVAYRRSTTWNNCVEYAVSFCSFDDMFNKKKGVKIALGRLEKNPNILVLPFSETAYENERIKYEIMDTIFEFNQHELDLTGMTEAVSDYLESYKYYNGFACV